MPKFPVDCPDCKIVPFQDHCYFLNFLDDNRKIAPNRNWEEAQKYCRDLSTDDWSYDLINVGSNEEYNFMIDGPNGKDFAQYGNKIYAQWKKGFAIWIGLNDRDQENQWKWSDGQPFEYKKWAPSEPNDFRVSQTSNSHFIT